MPQPVPSKTPPPSVRPIAPTAAILSYLVPGLGQIYQGRVGKGILFFVCLYSLFFYGMYLGNGKNVYIPDIAQTEEPWDSNPWHLHNRPLANLYNRLQFAGQFWIGVAAWPAVVQYATYDRSRESGALFGSFQRQPDDDLTNALIRNGDKTWDLGWVYTVIAGVLNILVIYDALAGPAFAARPVQPEVEKETAAV